MKYKFGQRSFWCRGYYVDTVGKNAQEIEDRIKKAFEDKNYSVVVVPSRYEKEMDKIKKYHKEYYQKNRKRLVQE